jgi:hypothetical protein
MDAANPFALHFNRLARRGVIDGKTHPFFPIAFKGLDIARVHRCCRGASINPRAHAETEIVEINLLFFAHHLLVLKRRVIDVGRLHRTRRQFGTHNRARSLYRWRRRRGNGSEFLLFLKALTEHIDGFFQLGLLLGKDFLLGFLRRQTLVQRIQLGFFNKQMRG